MNPRKSSLTQDAWDPCTQASAPPFVVQDYYLVHILGLTPSFINNHAKEMGSFGRPRNFLYKNVVAFLERIAEEAIEKSGGRERKAAVNAAMVDQMFEEICAMRDPKSNIVSIKKMRQAGGRKQ